jgi:hypothetical protein
MAKVAFIRQYSLPLDKILSLAVKNIQASLIFLARLFVSLPDNPDYVE